MNEGEIVTIVQEAIRMLLLLGAPVLGVSIIVGLIISIVQTTTSIQELTLTFVPKIVAIFVTIMLTAGWMFTNLKEYTVDLFDNIIRWGIGF